MNYVYEGPGPHEDPVIGLVRPGDVRQFDAEPDWGPWRKLSDAFLEASAPPPADPPAPELTPAELEALKKSADAFLAAGSIPPASSIATPSVTLREI